MDLPMVVVPRAPEVDQQHLAAVLIRRLLAAVHVGGHKGRSRVARLPGFRAPELLELSSGLLANPVPASDVLAERLVIGSPRLRRTADIAQHSTDIEPCLRVVGVFPALSLCLSAKAHDLLQ